MRAAVLGAGPIGLEAALALTDAGHDVVVLERGRVGEHVRQWGHVTLFTPWSMNTTAAGRARVGLEPSEACPTGAELVADYLEPLARNLDVRQGTEVLAISRPGLAKGAQLGSSARAEHPFQLLVSRDGEEWLLPADLVVDCTGCFGDPQPAGPGGMPAPGERAAAEQGFVRYGPAPIPEGDAHILLVGDGASATTVLRDALDRGVQVTWLGRSADGPGFVSPEDDPLPLRRTLYERARDAVARGLVDHRPGVGIARVGPGQVGLTDGTVLPVDRVVAACGLRPDHRLSRELQVHVCWGSEGPMKLAAALLSRDGAGSGDCLDQAPLGAASLRSPEPRFFVLGAKSYGRRSDFLLQVGHAQVTELLSLL